MNLSTYICVHSFRGKPPVDRRVSRILSLFVTYCPLNSFPCTHPWRPSTRHTCALVQSYVYTVLLSFINFIWIAQASLLKIARQFVFWHANVQSKWKRLLSGISAATEGSLQLGAWYAGTVAGLMTLADDNVRPTSKAFCRLVFIFSRMYFFFFFLSIVCIMPTVCLLSALNCTLRSKITTFFPNRCFFKAVKFVCLLVTNFEIKR